MNKEKAVVLTAGNLDNSFAKTCHGLLRGTDRFDVMAVVDEKYAGQDAGEVMDGKRLNIPVYGTFDAFLQATDTVPGYCIIGVAVPGGQLPESMRQDIMNAILQKMSIVNGLHSFLSEDAHFARLAAEQGVQLIDIRKPRPRHELRFWTGEIYRVEAPILAVLGTDCAVGKRTTCRFLLESCRANGIRTEMIYTGQTGWMQGYPYGFIFDSTTNDFVCGEMEKAIVECARALNPELILLEGQSSILNPSGPCGSEFILAGNAKAVVLQHVPGREYYIDTPNKMDTAERNIEVIEAMGAKVLGVTLNGESMKKEALLQYQSELNDRIGIPVIRPLEEGVDALIPVINDYRSKRMGKVLD